MAAPTDDPHRTAADEPARAVGRSIGKFRIVRELGRGAMGVVYEAFQDDLQRRVALKVIAPGLLAARADAADRFEREARLAAGVRHPGIVTVHEVGTADGTAYLAMEFVQGRSLAARLASAASTDRRIEPGECARIVLEAARAVTALHECGVVHRDLKPDNMLLDRDGRVRVTDFGVALLLGDGDAESAGTPGFMAPEQLSARFGPVGERSDVWALGAVLHVLLTGATPHAAGGSGGALDVMMATVERDLPPVLAAPGVPAALAAICRRCLEREPERRYASAAALADDLERWLRGDAPEATPPGLWRRLQLFCLRRRALSARLGTLFALEVLTLVDFVVTDTPTWYFIDIHVVLGALVLASLLLDWASRRGWLERATRFVWALLDATGLTWLLLDGEGATSSLVILYPLLVVSTGFWLDRAVVVAATALAMLGYAVLIVFPDRWSQPESSQHLVVFTTLLVTGGIVALQVGRARALRDYATRRR